VARYQIEVFEGRDWMTVFETGSLSGALACAREERGLVAVRVGERRVVVKAASDISLTYAQVRAMLGGCV